MPPLRGPMRARPPYGGPACRPPNLSGLRMTAALRVVPGGASLRKQMGTWRPATQANGSRDICEAAIQASSWHCHLAILPPAFLAVLSPRKAVIAVASGPASRDRHDDPVRHAHPGGSVYNAAAAWIREWQHAGEDDVDVPRYEYNSRWCPETGQSAE